LSIAELAAGIRYDDKGLVPAVIQDASNLQVLMVGYMNHEAVVRTLQTGRVTFWSRSRQEYWVKGERSGNTQTVIEARVDCDKDCLLLLVEQVGEACHEGYRTCFFRRITASGDLEITETQQRTPNEIYGSK